MATEVVVAIVVVVAFVVVVAAARVDPSLVAEEEGHQIAPVDLLAFEE